jgi:hypothetical protein
LGIVGDAFTYFSKAKEYMEELDAVDPWDLMESKTNKWKTISNKVMAVGHSPYFRDFAACKGKWHLILPNYQRILDYHARTDQEVYWSQSSGNHVAEGVPKSFSKELFDAIDEWFGRRPQITPPHVQDLLSPCDKNYKSKDSDSNDEVVFLSRGGEGESKEPTNISNNMKATEGLESNSAFCSLSFAPPTCAQSMTPSTPVLARGHAKTSPLLVSSFDTVGSYSSR